jgi:hypothetical protein
METTKKRRDGAAEIPRDLKRLLVAWKSGDRSGPTHFVTIVLCCMVYMQIPEGNIFLMFEVIYAHASSPHIFVLEQILFQ